MKPLKDTNMITLIFRLTFIVSAVIFLYGFANSDEGNMIFTILVWAGAEVVSKFLKRYEE